MSDFDKKYVEGKSDDDIQKYYLNTVLLECRITCLCGGVKR